MLKIAVFTSKHRLSSRSVLYTDCAHRYNIMGKLRLESSDDGDDLSFRFRFGLTAEQCQRVSRYRK